MMGARLEGTINKDKILRRFQNLLNLTYLQSEPLDGGGYRIPEKLFESIQTELDFNVSMDEVQTQKLEDQIKRRYRQRNSYRFWKDFLDIANISNDVDAKEYLMKIFHKLDTTRHYGSMTHSYYALETMQLALDDVYGTNNTILKDQNVHIWDENASREFLDSRNLQHLKEDDLGPIYGHQWRHFNATYQDCNTDYTEKGIDQLQYIINCLKAKP